ncbi:MAG: hypothetical protein ABI353_04045 [Isosphaeraceae bacterium]
MVLIASTAVGLAVLRASQPNDLFTYTVDGGSFPERVPEWSCAAMLGAAPLIAFWSLALLIIRLRKPRPPIRRLSREPGFIACVASALGILFGALIFITYLLRGRSGEWILPVGFPVGYAVAASWLTLVLNRRWRPVPDLLDRAGRVLGVYWIATVPAFMIALYGLLS